MHGPSWWCSPTDKARFARTLANLERAIAMLPVVVIFDNTDLARPFRLEAVYQAGKRLT